MITGDDNNIYANTMIVDPMTGSINSYYIMLYNSETKTHYVSNYHL